MHRSKSRDINFTKEKRISRKYLKAKNLLWPLKTRGIEDIRSKEPREDKEPTAHGEQNKWNSTSIRIPICNVNYKKQCHLKPAKNQLHCSRKINSPWYIQINNFNPPHSFPKKKNHLSFIRKFHSRFGEMTSWIKPVIISKLDVTDNKASTSCSVLSVKYRNANKSFNCKK